MSAIPLQRIEGKYEILEKIREGGMGAIYKVRHRLLDEIRVIKLMRQQLVDDEDLRARFLREARAAIKLRHPNITQLYDFTADEDGIAFIVMEYIRGKTLEDLLKSGGPPPLGLTIEIAHQSLRAIGYLHGKGFVHRDISPDNLMLAEDADGNPQIKLIDLGIAKILGGPEVHLTQTGAFLGKVRYASPEQFGSEGAPTADACGDLYSFGIVLYELLTGAYPISGRDPSSLIAGHLFRPPIPFEETDRAGRVPPGLRAVILKAMEKKPGDRHATAQEFARELAPFRVPGDIEPGTWNHLLELAAPAGETARFAAPGSTQARLDQNFVLREETPPPSQAAGSPRELVLVTPAAESQLAQQKQQEQQEQQEQQKQQEERVRAVAAAVQAVQEALSRGDLRTAEAQLYTAEAAFGEQPVFQSLHVQLAVQRREALAAQVMQLVESARRHGAAADLATALAELQAALRLDPARGDVAAEAAAIEAALGRQAAERQRREDVARFAVEIEAKLAEGDLGRAGELLDRAHAQHGEDPAFDALSELLREAQRRVLEAALAALLDEARQAAEAENFKEAGKLLRRAERMAPGDSRVQLLTAAVAEQSRRWEKARRVATLVEGKAAEVARHLDRGELEQGAALLAAAVVELGEAAAWGVLQARLERLRLEARQAQARSLLERARQQAARQELAQALESVRQAGEADPDNPAVSELAAELEAAQAREAREKRRSEEIARVSAEVQAHLDRGELDDAAKLLDLAVVRLGAAPGLRAGWQRLEELRRQALDRQVAGLIARARQLAAAGDPAAGQEQIRQAHALGADTSELRAASAEVETALARQADERRQAEDLAAAARAIEAHLDRGERARAGELLSAALAAHGQAEPLPRLQARLAALADAGDLVREARMLFEVQAFEEAARKLGQALRLVPGHAAAQALLEQIRKAHPHPSRAAKKPPAAPPKPAAPPEPAPPPKPAPPDTGLADLTLRLPATRAAAGATATAAVPAALAAGRSAAATAEILEPVPAQPPAAATDAVAPSGPDRAAPWRSLALPGIALAIAMLVGAGWFLTHRGQPQPGAPRGQESPAAPAPGASVVPAAPAAGGAARRRGALVVDALPWGEVTMIRDEHGVPQPLPKPATTPLVLSLPAGHYSIRLENPAFSHSVTIEAVVAAGSEARPARAVAEFRAADADDFLKRMGW
jgi:tRNA A-37 threonylcarbamoyl transferase component Bud32